MAFSPNTEWDTGRLKGSFTEVDSKRHFEFSVPAEGEFVPFEGFNQKVWVGGFSGEEFRWANVTKSRAFVVVDEADDGGPIVERWVVRNKRNFG